jgi:hypothetical protein
MYFMMLPVRIFFCDLFNPYDIAFFMVTDLSARMLFLGSEADEVISINSRRKVLHSRGKSSLYQKLDLRGLKECLAFFMLFDLLQNLK